MEAFDAPGMLAPAELPSALSEAAFATPPTLTAGNEGDDLVIALELTAFQKAAGS